jgi:O-antigen/teichoic acid export membrane protein
MYSQRTEKMSIIKKRTNGSLLQNIAALGAVQVASYLLPLITLPYVTRVLGAENWGVVAFVQVVIGYFTLLTNWGFPISGPRKISAHRNESELLSDIFIATWVAQWLICVLAIVLLIVLVLFIPYFLQYSTYYFWGIGIIIGNILFPVWFLSGLEQMRQIASIQIAGRLASVPLTLILIRSPEDAPLIIAIGGMTSIVSGIISILWIQKKIELVWRWPNFKRVIEELQEGATLFASSIWIGLYTTFIPIALGLVAGNAEVGYFTLADRVRKLAQSALAPISQSLFPRMSLLFRIDVTQSRDLLLKSSRYIILSSTIISVALWLFAENIVTNLAGGEFKPAIPVLQYLAPLPFIVSLSNIFGMQIMLPNRRTKQFNQILGMAGILSLVMIFPLIFWKGAIGGAVNVVIVESFVTLAMAIYVLKSGFIRNSFSGEKNES